MTVDRDRLVAAGLAVADDLEARGYPAAAVVRHLARAVAAHGTTPPAGDGRRGCRGCGAPLPEHRGPGRPRQWCSERCRDRVRSRERPGYAASSP